MMKQIHGVYTETYDINTAINEMSILGIHTPQAPALKKMFRGFFEQYRKYKILGCNFNMVCASQQSLDPSQVGLANDEVDPRDVLNPILFKACTGDNLNELLNQVYNKSEELTYPDVANTPGSLSQHVDSRESSFRAYYELLADETFRKEHPQRGITVTGLRPYVHKVVTTQPFRWNGVENYTRGSYPSSDAYGNPFATSSGNVSGFGGISGSNQDLPPNTTSVPTNRTVFVSDGITDMPWLETTYSYVQSMSTENSKQASFLITDVPRCYLGCLILPPAKVQRLFWRLTISWHVMFKDFRPACEVGAINEFVDTYTSGIAPQNDASTYRTYFNLYHTPTPPALTKGFSSFDSSGLSEVDVVNEKVQ